MSLEYLRGKKILITGGTGFVGKRLVQSLASLSKELDIQISCLVRSSSKRDGLPSCIQFFEANLSTGEGLEVALKGQDIFIHMAALLFGLNWQDYFTNVQAASNLGKAIAHEQANGSLSRVLFVSSLAASGPINNGVKGLGVDDNVIASPVSAYGWSKYISEEVLARHAGNSLVVLRPPIIYGSGDKGLLPYFKLAQKGLVMSPGFKRDFPVSLIHVQDMVQAILCALKPEAKGVYHCNDGYSEHNMQKLGQSMAKLMGKEAKCLTIPLFIMCITAYLSNIWGIIAQKLSLRLPSWNVDKYREAKVSGWLCNSQRLQDELGFKPEISLEAGLEEAITGYKNEGLL